MTNFHVSWKSAGKVNFLKARVIKRRTWKTLNVLSTLAIVLNTGMVGALFAPSAASAADTGFVSPSANTNSGWTNPENAYASDNARAMADSSSDVVQYHGFNFGVPSGATINGIEVQVEGYTTGTRQADISLSWNGGTDYTNGNGTGVKTTNLPGTTSAAEAYKIFGGSSDTWNRTWTQADFANFRVKLDATSGNGSNVYVDHVKVLVYYTPAPVRPTPAANPALGQTCGLDVALVIDSSGSIDSTELGQMKTAFNTFVDSFIPSTPTQMSVTEFDTVAHVSQPFTATASLIHNAVDAAVSGGFTNWDDGLAKAWSTFDPRPAKPNLVLFASDGNPNRKGNPESTASEADAVDAAVLQANTIKNAGTRIVALGIGNDLNVDNLKAISGPNVAPPAAVNASADVITANFDTLATTLSTLAKQLCGGKILVQKTFDTNGDGVADLTGNVPDAQLAGWNFDVNGNPSNPAAQTTTNTGALEFSVENGTYSVTETSVKAGTGLVSGICKLNNQTVGMFDAQTGTVSGLTMDTDQTISCTFLNQAKSCNLEITKTVDKANAAPGDTLTYTITYKNTGNSICTGGGVHITDVVPTGLTYTDSPSNHTETVDAAAQQYDVVCVGGGINTRLGVNYSYWKSQAEPDGIPGYEPGTRTLNWNANCVSPNESGTITFKATVNQIDACSQTDITNQAKIVADQLPNGLMSTPAATTHVTSSCEGSIKVNKMVDVNGTGSFVADNPSNYGFVWGVDGVNPARAMGSTASGLTVGSHPVTENSVSNYHFVGWFVDSAVAAKSCAKSQDLAGTTLPISVNVAANATTSITLCNARDTGRITFDKVVVGGTAKDGDFGFVLNDHTYHDGDGVTLPTGTYGVNENGPEGYTLTDASGACSLNQDHHIVLNVTTQGGTCVVTNTRDTGTLIVHKDVVNPDGGAVADTHAFSVLLNGANQKTIAEGTDATYSNLDTGTYTVMENADGDYTFVSYSADADTNTAGAQVTVTKGETTHLTVTNKQKKATITIYKDVRDFNGNDIADATSFNVTSGAGNFSIAEGSPKVLLVNPGSFTFTESANSNYTTTSTNPKTLTVDSNGQASYTFVNKQKPSSISGKKFEDGNGNGVKNSGENYLSGWKIYLDLNGNDQWDANEPYDITDGSGVYGFSNLVPGTYTIREVPQSGWMQTAPAGGEHTVNLGVNQTVTGKDFGNFELGKIWGYKYEDKNGDGNYDNGDTKLNGWTIELWKGGILQDSKVTGQNTATGKYEFNGLTAGTYTVTESLVGHDNWFASYPNLVAGHTVTVTSGTNTQKDFFNFKGFDLTVTKLIDADGKTNTTGDRTPGAGWTIQLWKNGNLYDTKVTGQDGTYTWTNLSYGSYQVKEVYDTNAWQALSNDAYSFTATSGQNKDYTFINWQRTPVQLAGYKIICDSEQTLPDWAYHNNPGTITASTAQNFVNTHEGCELVRDWNFQWGFSDQVGNPGDNTGEAAANWHTFVANGTPTTLPTFNGSKNLRVREVWNDLYIPFDGTINPKSTKVGAEFYCGTDIKNFDNYEYVDGVQLGLNGNTPTYYCVAFNVRKTGTVTFEKQVVGGNATTKDFSFTVNDVTYQSGDSTTLPTGTYAVSESGTEGTEAYVLTDASGVCSLDQETGDITMNVTTEGGTCVVTNTYPELTLEKEATPQTVGGNELVTYTITWGVKADSAKAVDVVVHDPIPANTTYQSASCGLTTTPCTISTTGSPVSAVDWSLGTRQPGEGGTLTLVVRTAISVPNGSTIPNEAKVSAAGVDPQFAEADVKAATAPQLQITKTANATIVNPGDPITYTVQVKNVGTDVAVNAVMTDTLPAGFTFVSTNPVAASIVGQTGTWNLGNMNVGDVKTITYTVNVAPGTTAGTYDNIAKAKADNASEVSTLVPVQTRVPQVLGETTNPVLSITKTVSKNSVNPGDVVTYTVVIKNTGSGSALNLTLTDVLPLGFTFNGTSLNTKSWTLGDLAVGASQTVTYAAKVGSSVPAGSYENLAVAQANNHGKVNAHATVTVKRGRVLGESVDTGAGWIDYSVAAVGASLIVLGFVLIRRKTGNELA